MTRTRGESSRDSRTVAHKRARKAWQAEVDTGQAQCTRCFDYIHPGQLWDLDHTDDRTDYLGPAHRGCNRSAGATKGNQGRARTPTPERDW